MTENNALKTIALIAMAIMGFIGLVGIALSYLNKIWFGIVFGACITGTAILGFFLIALYGPTKEKEPEAQAEPTKPGGD